MPALASWRARACTGLRGRVVELGFGSGRNIEFYPDDVDEVLALEPSALGRRMGSARIAAATVPVVFVGNDARTIPLGDGSCDSALTTFTLCSIDEVARALAEVRRVLRPGGTLHFLEHGLSPDETVARWQHRLDPLEGRLADGCHLTRDPVTLVRDAGFVLGWVEQRYVRGPRPWTYFTIGRVTAPTE